MSNLKTKINEDPDFIVNKKYNNSLKNAVNSITGGFKDSEICKMLLLSQEELDLLVKKAFTKIRLLFGEKNE